ncbi:hypothetical protein FNO01nite_27570 [Flavobacterium noncentrifugens]|uniref:Outer membrane protein beta-barrel domain-containing protein n=1 Tax=Flavobacterium noncentrifugens TaxID=1128970 RepID=A0A1G9CLV4_9FLAO|nr:porin family protein [Flavobacterium noncentrifugens]GEP52085.1 hypothetical protein FNO01nite_27570 [Flavobacterium noncentrifugens]SDK52691.1 Outer membrane protein beta-barrel domain-containing protein [Flavobacterium noncentrifugens]
MKKITLTALALCAFAFTQAQDIKFGAKAGLNLANLTTDYGNLDGYSNDNKMKPGFHVGGFVEIKISDKFAIQPEVLYSLQGTKVKSSEADFDGYSYSSEDKISLSYINVPVMVKFYPIEKLFIEAGPQVGFLISAKNKSEYTETDGDVTMSASTDVDVKDAYKSIDFGVNVGAGYEFTENLFASVRYNIGLSDIAEDGNNDEDLDLGAYGSYFKTRNSVLSISLGYKF